MRFPCRQIALLPAMVAPLVCSSAIEAQESAAADAPQGQVVKNGSAECVEPPPLIRWEDYEGPLQKVVGTFARNLERKSAHPPRYKAGAVLCSLEPKDKFMLFVRDTFDPISLLSAGFQAGRDQATDRDPSFGEGASGYGKRFGADFAEQTTRRFFTDFAYPTAFSEDPRYYRLGRGTTGYRLLHAAEHAFVAHRDNGKPMFNFSEWLGTASAVALNDVYHPGAKDGFAPAAKNLGFSLLGDVGFDVLREFWPEIARKLRMPFRDMRERAETQNYLKQGFTYAVDRVTGKPVWPIVERSVPIDSDIPGEKSDPTQPFSTKPPPSVD